MINLLKKNKNFNYLLIAGLLSELGGFLTDTAIALHLYHITDKNALYLGLVRGFYVLMLFLGNLLGGAVSYKFPMKKVLLYCEILRIPLTIGLLFLESPIIIIIVNSFIGLFTGIFSPTKKVMGNALVEKENIKSVQSLFSTSMAIIHLVAPAAAAYIYSNYGFSAIIHIDLFSYIIGIALIFSIHEKIKQPKETIKKTDTNLQLIIDGLVFTIKDLHTRAIFFNSAISGFAIGVLLSLLLPYLEILNTNASQLYGIFLSTFGLGGLLGGPLYFQISKTVKTSRIIYYSLLIESPLLLLWLQVTQTYLSVLIFFIWGVFVFLRLTAQFSFISSEKPNSFHSRLFSSLEIAFLLPNVLGSLVASTLVSYYEPKSILLMAGIFFLVATIVRIPTKDMIALFKEAEEN